jgi:hypothetical protein
VVLSIGLGALRKDRLAMTYARQMPLICTELWKRVKRSLKQGDTEYASDEYQRSLRMARWTAFQVEVDFCLIWVKPLGLTKPTIPKPYWLDQRGSTETWRPYPRLEPTMLFEPHGLYADKLTLREIGADIVPVMLSSDSDESPDPSQKVLDKQKRVNGLSHILERLSNWRDNLPSHERIDWSSTPTWPLVELHLVYNDYCIAIYAMLLRDLDTSESVRTTRIRLLTPCQEVAALYQWVQHTLGSTAWGTWGFQAGARAAYALFDMLAEPDVEMAEIFHTIVSCLVTAARRLILANGVLRMLWIRLQDKDLVKYLGQPTIELFQTSAIEGWGPEHHRLFESCIYPDYSAIKEKGRELADMGELLEKYSRLGLGREG